MEEALWKNDLGFRLGCALAAYDFGMTVCMNLHIGTYTYMHIPSYIHTTIYVLVGTRVFVGVVRAGVCSTANMTTKTHNCALPRGFKLWKQPLAAGNS